VPLGQVDGTVLVDGQPMGQVLVVFIPEDPKLPQSFGVTDESGRFELRCNNRRMGAAVGEHRVTLVDAAAAPAVGGRDDDPPPETSTPSRRVPGIYDRANRTPLRRSVAAGRQTIAIEIQSEKKPG